MNLRGVNVSGVTRSHQTSCAFRVEGAFQLSLREQLPVVVRTLEHVCDVLRHKQALRHERVRFFLDRGEERFTRAITLVDGDACIPGLLALRACARTAGTIR
jgi:hypothetical protein